MTGRRDVTKREGKRKEEKREKGSWNAERVDTVGNANVKFHTNWYSI